MTKPSFISIAALLSLLAILPAGKVFAAAPNGFALTFQNQIFKIDADTLTSWQGAENISPNKLLPQKTPSLISLLLKSVGQNPPGQNYPMLYSYSLASVYDYINVLSKQIDLPSQEPHLEINGGLAANFTPPQTGLSLDAYESSLNTLRALQIGASSSELSVLQTPPRNSLAQTNNLGINQLIAEGVSSFKGSPNNRRHNIAAGIEKFRGIIIPQGAEFSFNDNLGPVTAEAGFLPELVIANGTTLPELGGGLCQVSTTTFRAAMAAGLPITKRRNHAYAVSYYSPQGTDATIYPGSADLKFINDTPGAILIWPYEKDSNTLVFDFYGTGDGRQVTLEKPVVYDRTTDGAMKATWTRIVTLAGQLPRTDVFKSVYQSPALFHKTETFVSTTGAQTSAVH